MIPVPEKAPNLSVWRYFVLERDNYTCQSCGFQGNGKNDLHTHHISTDYNMLLVISNGQTLCAKCHRRMNGKKSKRGPSLVNQQIVSLEPKFMTLDEVATRLKVSRRTIYRWIKSGKFPALRLDGIYRIEEVAYEDFLDRARTNSTLADSREEAKVQ